VHTASDSQSLVFSPPIDFALNDKNVHVPTTIHNTTVDIKYAKSVPFNLPVSIWDLCITAKINIREKGSADITKVQIGEKYAQTYTVIKTRTKAQPPPMRALTNIAILFFSYTQWL